MPEKHLPIYKIRDFEEPSHGHDNFYFNYFQQHLKDHAFIQKPHKHNFYILLVITQGSGTHTIDFKTYNVTPGSIFFLSPGQVHAWKLAPDTEGYIIFFHTDFYSLQHPGKKIQRFPYFKTLLNPPYYRLNSAQNLVITEVLRSIEQEWKLSEWAKEDVIGNYLDILLIKLSRFYEEKYPANYSGKTYSEWQKLEELIEEHYRQHQPVTFYADQLHTTVKQLNDLCRNTAGKTISDLIQDRVILEARRLLTHSSLTITQIAAELGYFDNSYFARFFKKSTAQTPEQFRSQVNA